ncbi:16S rRNA (guanine(966)-N(2))-methyltransferase RsmD [Candidatus Margulisiibacteriota bacterium]
MRVISGKAKGRKLKQPKSAKVRPTRDMVKEALFDILGTAVVGKRFLDLYAGAGAIGIEALSRGAEEVVFIEHMPKLVHENLALTELTGGRVYGTKVATALKVIEKKGEKFDFIFLDPPYSGAETEVTLNKISSFDILAPDGLVIVEHHKQNDLAEKFGMLRLIKLKQYGETKISFYKK